MALLPVYTIPLSPHAQRMHIYLNGHDCELRFTYRDSQGAYADVVPGGWIMDVYDASGAPLALGLPLVTGLDILKQFEYLGLGVAMFVRTEGDPDAVPTFENLGLTSNLHFVVPT